MLTPILTLCLLCSLHVSCTQYPVRFDGHEVIRISNFTSKTGVENIYRIAESKMLDVWASNKVEGWVDVMIPPQLVQSKDNLFAGFSYEVKINDVQQDIERNELEREQLADPKDFFSDFQIYGAINEWLNEQALANPLKTRKISIGQTHQLLHIHALKISDNPDGEKSTIVIHCGIHAREWISPSTCCWIIDELLNKDADRDELISKFDFIIIPVLNADGYDYTHTTSRLWRKNRQPNPGSTCIGTDLNRNFDYDWGGTGASRIPCSDTYCGASPYSGPEARAVTNLLNGLSHVPAYIDIHSYGAMWMSPWGYLCTAYPPHYSQMQPVMSSAVQALRTINGRSYVFGAGCQTIYKTSGDCCDDSYGNVGIIHSYTIEAFGSSFTPSPLEIPRVGAEIWAGVKRTAQVI